MTENVACDLPFFFIILHPHDSLPGPHEQNVYHEFKLTQTLWLTNLNVTYPFIMTHEHNVYHEFKLTQIHIRSSHHNYIIHSCLIWLIDTNLSNKPNTGRDEPLNVQSQISIICNHYRNFNYFQFIFLLATCFWHQPLMMPKPNPSRRRPRFRNFVSLQTETIPPPPTHWKKRFPSRWNSNFGFSGYGRGTLYIGGNF